MGYTTTKIILSDGKPALRMDGLASGVVYLRVRAVSKEMVRNGELYDFVVKAQAYVVDPDGAEQPDAGPVVGSTEHGQNAADAGTMTIADLKARLIRQAVREYFARRAVLAAQQEFVGELL
jgi:hypothetical protein